MGMLLRRKIKALSENLTTTKSLGMEPLPFSDETTDKSWNNQPGGENGDDMEHEKDEADKEELPDLGNQFDEEPARRGRPKKSDM